ncbi:uncharacterized protein J8A68_004639 [[Candida] subhashii]|uniref:Uncharacterized protein n=1 Tax=[Candida] subhashii TaxID=561895 RepID=A0A8J5QRR6_9ASCO|nr:uncharacterized protein J8A68_004639 [[Candida] subhashii]KAG7661840.1 hypothetical protein J8A68_004639 [[Candida] subhashii]
MFPVLITTYLIPKFIGPESFEYIETNFRAHLLSKPYCDSRPDECRILMDLNYGDPKALRRKYYAPYEAYYLRHYTIEIWDEYVLKLITMYPSKKLVLFIATSLYELDNEDEFFAQFVVGMEILLGIFDSMAYQVVKGVIVSRVWILLILAGIFTVIETWGAVFKTLRIILRNTSSVY